MDSRRKGSGHREDGEGRDLVGQVHDAQFGRDRVHHALAERHRIVHHAEVGHEYDRGRGGRWFGRRSSGPEMHPKAKRIREQFGGKRRLIGVCNPGNVKQFTGAQKRCKTRISVLARFDKVVIRCSRGSSRFASEWIATRAGIGASVNPFASEWIDSQRGLPVRPAVARL